MDKEHEVLNGDKWVKFPRKGDHNAIATIVGAVIGAVATIITGQIVVHEYYSLDNIDKLLETYFVIPGYISKEVLEKESLEEQFKALGEQFELLKKQIDQGEDESGNHESVDLLGMETSTGEPMFRIGTITDTYGNEQTPVYLKDTNYGDTRFEYRLNGEYSALEGTLWWSKDYKNDIQGYYYLMFYEGDRLLGSTLKCAYNATPIEFSIDISSVEMLTVVENGYSNDGPFTWGAQITVS